MAQDTINTSYNTPNPSVNLGALDEALVTPKGVSESDHMVYLGFLAMIEAMSLSEDTGASLADMSKMIYDTMVVNGSEKVKELQQDLEALSFAMDKWENYAAYLEWEKKLEDAHKTLENSLINTYKWYSARTTISLLSGKPPALPDVSKEINEKNLAFVKRYDSRKSSGRAYINGVSQQLSVQNTYVSNNKKLGDTLQQQVKSMVNDQSVYAGLITNLLRITQRQLQYGHR